MAKKSTGGNFYLLLFFSDSVCMYVCIYIGGTLGRRSCQTSDTHIFCQFYSMQQHADSIIRVNGSRADGGEGPRGPCYFRFRGACAFKAKNKNKQTRMA